MLRLSQADKEQDTGSTTDDYPPDPYRVGHGRGMTFGERIDSFYKSYQTNYNLPIMPTTDIPPGPNGVLPIPADQVWLNNPNSTLCQLTTPLRPPTDPTLWHGSASIGE